PPGQNEGVGQALAQHADSAQNAGHAVVGVSIVGRGQNQPARPPLAEPFHHLFHVAPRRLVAWHAVTLEVPADRLGPQDVALETELGLTHRDLLLIVEPGRRDVALAGEDQYLDHRQAPTDCVLVNQTGASDRSIVGVGAKHHQRPVWPHYVTQRISDVDELPMSTEAVHGLKQAVELGAPAGQTRRWIGGVRHGFWVLLKHIPGAAVNDRSDPEEHARTVWPIPWSPCPAPKRRGCSLSSGNEGR